MGEQYEVIIVGAGTMGMAAGYFLAKQGVKTLLIDRFDPPHGEGSHAGETRIIRFAYGEGREYVPLALRSKELWDELAAESGKKLFEQTGVLGFGPLGTDFIEEAIESAREHDLPLEVLRAAEINERWTGITVPDHYYGCFEPTSGALYSAECIRAYRDGALESGATLLVNTVVEEIITQGDYIRVHTSKGSFTAGKVILTAGSWAGGLLEQLGVKIKLEPLRQAHGYFNADENLYDVANFPIYLTQTEDATYYGFPRLNGTGMKAGRHDIGQKLDEQLTAEKYGEVAADEGDTRGFLERFMPAAAGELIEGLTCLYTKTPDEHFVIDFLPGQKNIVVAAGFSGHGFKFASVIGEILTELVTKGESRYDLGLFKIDREALK